MRQTEAMDRTGSRAAVEASIRKLFVVGCPRSGTTWLQLLLDHHPRVVTAPETQIFAYYLDGFRRQWRHEHEGPGRAYQGNAGLSRLLSQEEFDDLCRLTASAVLRKIALRDTGADLVVEKSPKHALQADFIRRLYPEACFIHVVRDPRDTVASLLAAGRSWGRGWAPKCAVDAARLWIEHVRAARSVREPSDRYREVRFESLKSDAARTLQGIFDWLGLHADRERCEAAARACELSRLRRNARRARMPVPGERSPAGFFRKGTVGGWRDDLSAADLRVVEFICRETMIDLGYEPVLRERRSPPLALRLHDAIQRVRESVDWQLERLLRRV